MDFGNAQEFVVWLGTTGGLGAVLSFLLERLSGFQGLRPDVKRGIVVGALLLVSLLSRWLLLAAPPEFWTAIEPYFQAIAMVFVVAGGWLFTETVHRARVKRHTERD